MENSGSQTTEKQKKCIPYNEASDEEKRRRREAFAMIKAGIREIVNRDPDSFPFCQRRNGRLSTPNRLNASNADASSYAADAPNAQQYNASNA
ncbi:unnamed protein product [Cuscuta campestris]|uniref:Uncharacterized protein n=1 Tax=Cuscuta campestris TaxID=132261 RepID=A0A484K478_9ASTE|nr:unnamed protein product [Cuscuta campestris]